MIGLKERKKSDHYFAANVSNFLSNYTTPWNTSWLSHAYYFITDEPPIAICDRLAEIAARIHGVAPQLAIMQTLNEEPSKYPKAFLDEINIFCFYIFIMLGFCKFTHQNR